MILKKDQRQRMQARLVFPAAFKWNRTLGYIFIKPDLQSEAPRSVPIQVRREKQSIVELQHMTQRRQRNPER